MPRTKPPTMHDRYLAALLARGEEIVGKSVYTKVTCQQGGFYFIGRSGALRVGKDSNASQNASDELKAQLLAEGILIELKARKLRRLR